MVPAASQVVGVANTATVKKLAILASRAPLPAVIIHAKHLLLALVVNNMVDPSRTLRSRSRGGTRSVSQSICKAAPPSTSFAIAFLAAGSLERVGVDFY